MDITDSMTVGMMLFMVVAPLMHYTVLVEKAFPAIRMPTHHMLVASRGCLR